MPGRDGPGDTAAGHESDQCGVGAPDVGTTDEPESDVVETTIVARADGPLVVTGRLVLTGPDGTTVERTERMVLCRCGASADKPRCDGAHKRIGFTAPGVVPPRKP